MAYVVLADIEGKIPPGFLTQALDDDADGDIDAFDQVAADADGAVNAILGLRFETPFTGDIPGVVTEAAKIHVCYSCYQRRGVGEEQNPWATRFAAYFGTTGLLTKIATGTVPLGPAINRAKPSATLIGEKAPTHDKGGRRLS